MVDYPESLQLALLALSYFRHRNDRIPLYRNPNSKAKREQTYSKRPESVRRCRRYLRRAREAGWKGSVVQACMEINTQVALKMA